MTLDVVQFSFLISLAALVVGASLWGLAFLEKAPLRRMRMTDCGTVLVFSSILLRFAGQTRPLNAIEWGLALLSPLFVAAALWRLVRTHCPPGAEQ
ncbi:hypothetical protein [Brevundimonas lenta]|uniref:Uncharacterized protein n=1 Tax=Brevundimonas lenta TaxID=424796 RepID=A0A7W6JEF0_9CAUL|nr:hypothetical protein [Brevundimonas lenta]MBB4083546.1 hypothetical protein [Brevundimonas lenta]